MQANDIRTRISWNVHVINGGRRKGTSTLRTADWTFTGLSWAATAVRTEDRTSLGTKGGARLCPPVRTRPLCLRKSAMLREPTGARATVFRELIYGYIPEHIVVARRRFVPHDIPECAFVRSNGPHRVKTATDTRSILASESAIPSEL